MAQITVTFKGGGETTAMFGSLMWTPSARHLTGTAVVLPTPFATPLTTSPAVVTVPLSGPGWCWQVQELVPGGGFRHVLVVGDADYSALQDVDPASLLPTAVPPAAWVLGLAALQTGVDSATAAATLATTTAGAATSAAGIATTAANTASADLTAATANNASLIAAAVIPAATAAVAATPTVVNAAAAAVSGAMVTAHLAYTLIGGLVSQSHDFTTLRGTPTYGTPARFGAALTAGVVQAVSAIAEPTTGLITVEFWMSRPLYGAVSILVSLGDALWIGLQQTTAYIELALDGSASLPTHIVVGTANIADGAQHHVAFTLGRTAGTTTFAGLWVDGQPIAGTPTLTPKPWVSTLTIRGLTAVGYDQPTGAGIDDVRVSSGARYAGTFTVPSAPAVFDATTLLLASMDSPSYLVPVLDYPPRPVGAGPGTVTYIGTTQPMGWLTNDQWVQTT